MPKDNFEYIYIHEAYWVSNVNVYLWQKGDENFDLNITTFCRFISRHGLCLNTEKMIFQFNRKSVILWVIYDKNIHKKHKKDRFSVKFDGSFCSVNFQCDDVMSGWCDDVKFLKTFKQWMIIYKIILLYNPSVRWSVAPGGVNYSR